MSVRIKNIRRDEASDSSADELQVLRTEFKSRRITTMGPGFHQQR